MSETHETDPYWKLKPPPPTSGSEVCSCSDKPPIILQPHLSYNPISCLLCNLEVPPERNGFDAGLADDLASWRNFHDSFYHLWLDSGEFETWAKAQLSDRSSPVNERGIQLAKRLHKFWRCYYWWFQDTGEDDFEPVSGCPRCGLEMIDAYERLCCEKCAIVVAN